MPIYLKIKQLIDDKGISQKELAKMAGIHESTLSDIVRDSRNAVNKNHLEKIMIALEIKDFNMVFGFDKSE